MKVRRVLSVAYAFMTVSVGIQAAAQTIESAETTETISVNDGRPVAKALEALEKKYGLVITYEDPGYTHPSDIQDVTALVSKHPSSGGDRRILVPKGGAFQFQYGVNNGKPQEDTKTLIRRMLTEYASLGGPVFDVQDRATERHRTEWHVVPFKVRNKGGQFVQQTALLDNIISIPQGKRSGFEMLGEICQQLSILSGHRVGIGLVPLNPLGNSQGEFGATNQPARDVLADLLNRFSAPLVWQLFYDPGLGWYMLNVHVSPNPPSTTSRTTSSSASPSSTSSPSRSDPSARRARPQGSFSGAAVYHQPLTPGRTSVEVLRLRPEDAQMLARRESDFLVAV